MHPDNAFRHDDRALLEALIDQIGFGMVFATTPDGPRVAHVALLQTGDGAVQFHLSRGNALAKYLDGMTVLVEMYDERPMSVQLPEQVEATIVEADAVVKGQTASCSYKPAILDNGLRVMVPPHIGSGTRIIVDVYERSYVGKVG